MEHVAELRRRLFYIVLSVMAWSTVGYFIQHQLIDILLEPAHGQKFIYTSPIGGMNFLLKVAFYMGLAFSLPVIVYQLLRYIEPLMKKGSSKFIFWGSVASGVCAVGGILFGYFFGLPAALHFLLNQFITSQVSALLTIENYLSFVTMYMFGAAIMFQIPLVVLFINRVKPLKPAQLMKAQRWVIISTVVLAFIMNPTPSLIDQMFLAVPMVLSYQLAIVMIWWLDKRNGKLRQMRDEDERARQQRLQKLQDVQTTWDAATELADNAEVGLVKAVTENAPSPALQQLAPEPVRFANDVTPARPVVTMTPQSRPAMPRANYASGTRGPRPLRSKYIQ